MSLCVRTISKKLTPFVGRRRPVTRLLRRQLPNDIETSRSLRQRFSGAGAVLGCEATTTTTSSVKPLETTSDNIVAWNYKLVTEGNWIVGRNERDRGDEVATCRAEGTVGSEREARVGSGEESRGGRPSHEQLHNVYKVLRTDLPQFFVKAIDYSIYHSQIVFENKIKNTTTTGIYEYVRQASMLRISGHIKFAYVKFDVLKMTVHPEDDSIKVRWRIRGITGTKVFINFWKMKVWKLQPTLDQLESWHDGFSTFYVDDTGKVIKHVADKMMPDQDTEVTSKNNGKTGIAAKLALFLALFVPRGLVGDDASRNETRFFSTER